MTKKPKADNDRVYQKDWEKLSEFKGWLQECPPKHRINNQKQQAYCTWCNVALRCHKNSIKRHSETIVHKQAASSRVRKTQPVLAKSGIYPVGSNESKIIDIKLVINAAVHGTMCSLDHITEILNQYSKDSLTSKLRVDDAVEKHCPYLEGKTNFALTKMLEEEQIATNESSTFSTRNISPTNESVMNEINIYSGKL
ncbi:hypothetical protein HCN44_004795 [Aphidius gifuensis]|uniref:Uncharacterized protein n=1 Tax=Aphidius gifuensis TaxID=684658 RepID=A0A835CM39_APHGI|nr:hypothetical protein HCN44_004795 [Aphidius gifuensis]